ncbi:MAG: C4-dicarboxylate ABC transporter substrate-binding protein [Gammaproteobacteria bacterium]|nr:C4-dicarboxylate ABC transporter substrate-binding protein [Gammaproteobacteria bacterium]
MMKQVGRVALGGIAAWTMTMTMGVAYADSHNKGVVDGPRVHWDYALWGKPREITTYLTNLEKWLPEQTGGKFTLQLHWGTLSKPRAILDNLKAGSFQSGSFCASYYPGKLSAHTGLDLPFLPIHGLKMLKAVTHEYYQHPTLQKEMRNWNARFYMSSLLPLYEIVGKGEKPTSLDAFKGMRIRALGQQGKAMEKLGAVPTSVPAPEVYTSMDRGLLDAVGFAYYAHKSYRTFELGNWFTSGLSLGSIACGSMFNLDDWAALPPQYQKLLNDFVESDLGYPDHIAALDAADKTVPGEFVKAGLTEWKVNPTERAEFVKMGGEPVWKDWAEEMSKQGYNGQELLDAILSAIEKHKGLAE